MSVTYHCPNGHIWSGDDPTCPECGRGATARGALQRIGSRLLHLAADFVDWRAGSHRDLPTIPPLSPDVPGPGEPVLPNRAYARCGECGITLYERMSYSCPRARCPAGLGPKGSA